VPPFYGLDGLLRQFDRAPVTIATAPCQSCGISLHRCRARERETVDRGPCKLSTDSTAFSDSSIELPSRLRLRPARVAGMAWASLVTRKERNAPSSPVSERCSRCQFFFCPTTQCFRSFYRIFTAEFLRCVGGSCNQNPSGPLRNRKKLMPPFGSNLPRTFASH
jgi:hypothetical protein